MYKVGWIARFARGADATQARRYWADVHGPLLAKVPGVERYVQNHAVGSLPAADGTPEQELQFDGYSCAWWADERAFSASMRSPEWQAVLQDARDVFDTAWGSERSAQLREVCQIDGPAGPYKVVWIVAFNPALDRVAADASWAETHGRIFHGLPIDRYVQNHAIGPVGTDRPADGALGFDGFSECWFTDEDQYLRALDSPAWADAIVDTDRLFDMPRLLGAVVEEHVLKASGPAG